ncbi:hypothetical protein [Kineococcus terrestris]|uniref:hypothetical protein n=1 Tax=Kineococcus terrestris TaxID=2044856 RepID=UPI0034DB2279
MAVAITTGTTVAAWFLPRDWSIEVTGWSLTLLGALLALVVVLTNRWVRFGAGVVTTAMGAGAGLLLLLAIEGGGWFGLLAGLTSVLPVPIVFAVAVTAATHALRWVPAERRWWAAGVAATGAGAWLGWLSWWTADAVSPGNEGWLTVGALLTLAVATVVGEVMVRPWSGVALALVPASALALGPLVSSDALGAVAWFFLTVVAAGGCALVAVVVALLRRWAGQRRQSPAGG